ncbi:MAG: cation:proton antiporter [Clostridia bacterium]|nr:cation:proton antiporter [Clostridia bacterium]
MLMSVALIFIAGLLIAAVFEKIKLPRIIGMLVTGIILGPYALNVIDGSVLDISADLRQIALIIILIKAGLSLNIEDLKRVGRPAVMMSCVPAGCEILAFVIFAPYIFGISRIEGAVMGAVLAAVSPAVVVPRMVKLTESKWGTGKSIPQLIMAGASCDDIFVIVLFSTFVNMAQGGRAQIVDIVSIPVSIVTGILIGGAAGYILSVFFERAYLHNSYVRNSTKVIIVLSIAFLLVAGENYIKTVVPVSGLIGVVSMACVLKIKSTDFVSKRLSQKFGKLWIGAEVMLFVLVGAAVDIRYSIKGGGGAVLMIFTALIFRAVGVLICLLKTKLNLKERIFCVIAYMPKATVQAAIGSVPLALGLDCGQTVLSVAVTAILVTAPLGALGIDASYKRLLKREE